MNNFNTNGIDDDVDDDDEEEEDDDEEEDVEDINKRECAIKIILNHLTTSMYHDAMKHIKPRDNEDIKEWKTAQTFGQPIKKGLL